MSPVVNFLHFICLIGKLSTAHFRDTGAPGCKSMIWNKDILSPGNIVAHGLLRAGHKSLSNS